MSELVILLSLLIVQKRPLQPSQINEIAARALKLGGTTLLYLLTKNVRLGEHI